MFLAKNSKKSTKDFFPMGFRSLNLGVRVIYEVMEKY